MCCHELWKENIYSGRRRKVVLNIFFFIGWILIFRDCVPSHLVTTEQLYFFTYVSDETVFCRIYIRACQFKITVPEKTDAQISSDLGWALLSISPCGGPLSSSSSTSIQLAGCCWFHFLWLTGTIKADSWWAERSLLERSTSPTQLDCVRQIILVVKLAWKHVWMLGLISLRQTRVSLAGMLSSRGSPAGSTPREASVSRRRGRDCGGMSDTVGLDDRRESWEKLMMKRRNQLRKGNALSTILTSNYSFT